MDSIYLWSFTGIFIFFVLIGALLGLWRGMYRSIVRFLSVFIAAFIAFFITAPITKLLLNMNISGLNIVISGVAVTTVNDTLLALLNKIPYVSEVVNLSPTFKSFLLTLPQIILNIILFIILFVILIFVMWIVYRIVARFVAPNKDKEGNKIKKNRWAGALIGGFQGLLVFIVMLLPILGVINLASDTVSTVDEYNKSKSTAEVAYIVSSNSNSGFEAMSLNTTAKKNSGINMDSVHRYLDPVENVWVVKTLNFIKVGNVADSMLDSFSKIEVKDTKTTLRAEVNSFTNIYIKYDEIKDLDIDNVSDADVEKLSELVDEVFSSPLYKNIIGEALPNIASKWTESTDAVLGIKKPDLGGNLSGVVDSLLRAISLETVNEVEKDFKAVPNILKTTSSAGLMKNLKDGGDGAFKALSKKSNVENLIDAMLKGPAFKQTIPALFDTGLGYVYPLIDVPADDDVIYDNFYQKLIDANTKYAADTSASKEDNLKNNYEKAFKYLDYKIIDIVPTPVPDYKYILSSSIDDMKNSVEFKNYKSKSQFEEYFRTHGITIEKGNVVNQNELKITVKSSQINWDSEKKILADIFSGFYTVYDANNRKSDTETALDVVDFDVFADVLDGIRKSELFDNIDQKLILSFLQSSIMEDLSIGEKFMDMVKDDEDFESVDFHELFNTLKVVRGLKSSDSEDLSSEDVSSLLNILTGEGSTTKDVIVEMASEENLAKSGVDANTANAISTIVNGITGISDEDAKQTTDEDKDAIQSAVTAMENANKGNNSFKDNDEAYKFVKQVMSSPIIYAATIDNENYVIKTDKETIVNALNKYYTDDSDSSSDTLKLQAIYTKCETINDSESNWGSWTPTKNS